MKRMGEPKKGCTVELVSNYIDVCWDGRISREMAAQCNEEILAIAKKLDIEGKPIYVRFHAVDPPALPNIDAFSEAIKVLDSKVEFTRLVLWGKVPTPVRLLFATLLESFSHTHNIRYIEDEKEATSWLLNG